MIVKPEKFQDISAPMVLKKMFYGAKILDHVLNY